MFLVWPEHKKEKEKNFLKMKIKIGKVEAEIERAYKFSSVNEQTFYFFEVRQLGSP